MHSFLCGLPVNNWAVWNGSGGSALYRIHFFTCFTIYCFWFNFCCGNSNLLPSHFSEECVFFYHNLFIDWRVFAMLLSDWYNHNSAWDVQFSAYMVNKLHVLVFLSISFQCIHVWINVISSTINNIMILLIEHRG